MIKRIFALFTLLVVCISCAPVDDSSVTITYPLSGARLTTLPAGDLIPVQVIVSSTQRQNYNPKICIEGECTTCTVVANQETICTLFHPRQVGEITLNASIERDNGLVISDKVTFSWQPYSKFETFSIKVASLFGKESLVLGYFTLCLTTIIILILIFFLGIYLPRKQSQRGPATMSLKKLAETSETYIYHRGSVDDIEVAEIVEGEIV